MDIAALKRYLEGKGSPLTIAAADPALPQELRAFLDGMPNQAVTLIPGPEGIRLDGTTLTVSGTSTDSWPVQGLFGVAIALTQIRLVIQDGSPPVIDCTANGRLPLSGAVEAPTTVTALHQESNPWQVQLAEGAQGVTPTDLLLLGQVGPLPFAIPPELDMLSMALSVQPDQFQILFYPNTKEQARTEFTLSAPQATWILVTGLLSFDGIDLESVVLTNSTSTRLIGHITIGGVGLDAGVALNTGDHWSAFLRPTQGDAFPGLAALAAWIGGEELASEVNSGFESVGFDSSAFDLALTAVTMGFNWRQTSLDYLDIQSLLTLGALKLDVLLRLPDVTLVGTLHKGQAVSIKEMLASYGLPTETIPEELSIAAANFSAHPSQSVYSVGMTVDNLWRIGPVALEEVSLTLSYLGVDGVTGQFDAVIAIGDAARIGLMAEYLGGDVAWRFSGGTAGESSLQIGELISYLASSFGIEQVPEPIRSLSLTNLNIAYETGTGKFTFTCEGDFTVAETPVRLTVSVDVSPTQPSMAGQPGTVAGSQGYSATFAGQVLFSGLAFDLIFNTQDTGANLFVAAYHHTGDWGKISVRDLVAEVSSELASGVPAGLTIDLKSVKFIFYGEQGGNRFAFGLDLGPIHLSDLPLIGDKLPAAESLWVSDLQVTYSTGDFTQAQAGKINALLPSGVAPLPAEGLGDGLNLQAALHLGSSTLPLSLGMQGSSGLKSQAAELSADSGSSNSTKWFDIQRSFGPAHFGRIGIRMDDGLLWFLLDASLTLSVITMQLEGLGVGSPVDRFEPNFHLDGLGVAYSSPPLQIGGAFLAVPESQLGELDFEYQGAVTIGAANFALAAVGAYAQAHGQPSMFIFGALDTPLGGPPYFFITGLMAGFGFNRRLRIPEYDQVYQFPFIRGLTDKSYLGPGATPLKILDILDGRGTDPQGKPYVQWITPAMGEYWLAAGLQWTTFKLINAHALAVVQFGQDLTIALLGLATARLPQSGSVAFAYVELQISVVLDVHKGLFRLTAALSPNSFVLDPDCKLTGGFAFYMWFLDEHQGDFVLTLGGYHPSFQPPAHYPRIPRLGFNWPVTKQVTIHGEAYFALTPSMVMGGGLLDIRFRDGALQAWFTAKADFLMQWNPFYFTGEMWVSVGASYKLDLGFTSKTVKAELGARLKLWGPRLGGTVHVDWYIISFSVNFGAKKAVPQGERSWSTVASMLPDPESIVTITASAGLLESPDGVWLVRADEFRFATQTAIPANQLLLGDGPAPHIDDSQDWMLDIRPMGRTGLISRHRVQMVRVSSAGVLTTAAADGAIDLTHWSPDAPTQSVPEALWGQPVDGIPTTPAAKLLRDRRLGYRFSAPAASQGTSTGEFPAERISFESLPDGYLPLSPHQQPDGEHLPYFSATSVQTIVTTLSSQAPARSSAHGALRRLQGAALANGSLDRLQEQAPTLYRDPPVLATK